MSADRDWWELFCLMHETHRALQAFAFALHGLSIGVRYSLADARVDLQRADMCPVRDWRAS